MNPLKRRHDEGGTALGIRVSIPSVRLALAGAGIDRKLSSRAQKLAAVRQGGGTWPEQGDGSVF